MLDKTAHGIDQEARDIFTAALKRRQMIEAAHRETERAAKILRPKLIGKHILKSGKRYEVTEVSNGYNGTLTARGYVIKANGKRGTQIWDIGFICPDYFDEAA